MSKLVRNIMGGCLIALTILLLGSFTVRAFITPTELIPEEQCEWIEENEYAYLDPYKVIWLARIINGESHGESMHDKLLVGSVVMNRLKSPSYPNTIYSVIHHANQFDGLNSRYFRYSTQTEADLSSIKAAQRILKYGPINKNIIFFLNPRISTDSKWVKKVMQRKLEARSENHYFYS